MNKLIAVGVAAILMASIIPGVDADSREVETIYLPGALAPRADLGDGQYAGGTGLLVWCSEDEHTLIPNHDPDLDDPDSLPGWAFSGEPECAYADAVNAGNDATGNERLAVGLGAAAWELTPNELGGTLESSTEDDNFGSGQQYQAVFADECVDPDTEEAVECDIESSSQPTRRVREEGCGTINFDIPVHTSHHWQSAPGEEYFLAWTGIYSVGITSDLGVCLASSGIVTAVIETA